VVNVEHSKKAVHGGRGTRLREDKPWRELVVSEAGGIVECGKAGSGFKGSEGWPSTAAPVFSMLDKETNAFCSWSHVIFLQARTGNLHTKLHCGPPFR
jgi:hypothetical protein